MRFKIRLQRYCFCFLQLPCFIDKGESQIIIALSLIFSAKKIVY
jgi:hypothetical protein